MFGQVVADRRQEINEDLAAGRLARVKWVKMRWCYDLFEATIVVLASRLLKAVSLIRKLIG